MFASVRALGRDESGATAVEYGLIVGDLGADIVVVFLLGGKFNNSLSKVANHL